MDDIYGIISPSIETDNYMDSGYEVEDTDEDIDDIDEQEDNDSLDSSEEEPTEVEDSQEDTEEVSEEEPVQATEEPIEEYPGYLPEDFHKPDFKTQREELNWYKNNYDKVIKYHQSPEYMAMIARDYDEHFTKVEQAFEKKYGMHPDDVMSMLGENPDLFLKRYAPQYLIPKGYDTRINDEERQSLIARTLQKEFGEDYYQIYNPDQAKNPNTISGRMIARQNQILRDIEAHNQKSLEDMQAYQPPSEDTIKAEIEKAYETEFKTAGIPRDDFDKFIEDTRKFKYSLSNIHHMVYHRDYMEQAYKKGLTDGKKSLTQEIRTVGRKLEDDVRTTPKSNGKYKNVFDHLNPGGKFAYNPFL